MSEQIKFTIDGKECTAQEGQTVVAAAKDNGIFIPTLCDYDGLKPSATCRICTVNIQGRPVTACTAQVSEGMEIENNTDELQDMRKAIIEMLFVEGNHYCPSCEKSGNCELQALAYRYTILVPRFPFVFPTREVDASSPKLMKEQNRCIRCKRCVRSIITKDGKHVYQLLGRGKNSIVEMDHTLAALLSDEEATRAMDVCPVGSIIKKERGFETPIGKRKYDTAPIGSDIEA